MILGYDELKENRVKVKDMKSGEQISLSFGNDFVQSFLSKFRKMSD